MASAKLVLGGAGAAALGVRVARALYGRWRLLPPWQRAQLEPLAEHTKASALELRGAGDREAAGRDLNAASEQLAAAMIETAEADPELDDVEVEQLRDDLRRELERLATADIKASRAKSATRPPRAG